jgi:hypothetical protein
VADRVGVEVEDTVRVFGDATGEGAVGPQGGEVEDGDWVTVVEEETGEEGEVTQGGGTGEEGFVGVEEVAGTEGVPSGFTELVEATSTGARVDGERVKIGFTGGYGVEEGVDVDAVEWTGVGFRDVVVTLWAGHDRSLVISDMSCRADQESAPRLDGSPRVRPAWNFQTEWMR